MLISYTLKVTWDMAGSGSTKKRLKNILTSLEWNLDYYLIYFLYNPNKIHNYHTYLNDKWHIESANIIKPVKKKYLIIKQPNHNHEIKELAVIEN